MSDGTGHKAARHILQGEAYQRIMRGEEPQTLNDFADELLAWLQQTHPSSTATLREVEDDIRDTWHRRHELARGGG